MNNHSWSLSFGRWLGVPVRIHAIFFLFVAVIFAVQWSHMPSSPADMFGTALATALVLLISVIVHELAHVFAIANLGGDIHTLVLTPWGGNSEWTLPAQAPSRALVYVFGPFISLAIFLMGASLLIQTNNAGIEELINPLRPLAFTTEAWEVSLIRIVTWVNFQLLLVNLLPCFPFDGAGFVRSIIHSLNTDLPAVRVESAISVMGNAVALTLMGLAWLSQDYNPGPIRPTWFLLLSVGIILHFASRYSFHRETTHLDSPWDDSDDFGLDHESMFEDSAFFSLDQPENAAYSKWLVEKQEARMQDELRMEQEEEERSDAILEKLHHHGLKSLSEEDRTLLHRVSERCGGSVSWT